MGAVGGKGRQDGVQPHPARQEPIDIGTRVIEPAAGQARETDRQPAHGGVVAHLAQHAGQPRPTVDPHAGRSVDQDVGHRRIGQERFERPRTEDLRRQLRPGLGHPLVAQPDGVLGQHLPEPAG